MKPDYDVLIIGSGFGGSVTALRLTEKGYRVGVLEAGRRFADEEFAKTSWNLRKFLWAPKLGMYGIQRIHLLRNVMILAGAGVGGGSLNYANTLYVPPEPFFDDPQWKHITDWRAELMPHYDQAQRMLGVVKNPTFTDADRIIKEVADDMGVGDTFVATPVGRVLRSGRRRRRRARPCPTRTSAGPGPTRTGCIECGSCMTGCRYGAKNTLGQELPRPGGNGWGTKSSDDHRDRVRAAVRRAVGGRAPRAPAAGCAASGARFTATHVVLAAGTFGTQKLLFKMRDKGKLPKLSDKLGVLTRTNSESIVGAGTLRGVATISTSPTAWRSRRRSIRRPTPTSSRCRYGKGSNAMGLLQTLMTDGAGPQGTDVPRWRQLLPQRRARIRAARCGMLNAAHWSERTMIALVMQHLDNSITTFTERTQARLPADDQQAGPRRAEPDVDSGRATRSPAGIAKKIDGVAGGTWGELFNIPLTAHFLGGAAIGDSPEHGVIDPYQRVYRLPDAVRCIDGASVSANLGVNPSLSITAQAERAASLWPNKGEVGPAAGAGRAVQAACARSRRSIRSCPPMRPAALRRIPFEPVEPGQLGWLKAPGIRGYYLVPCGRRITTVSGPVRSAG